MNSITKKAPKNTADFLSHEYEISATRGCLPTTDPAIAFSTSSPLFPKLEIIEQIGETLPVLLCTGALETWMKWVRILDDDEIKNLKNLLDEDARLLMVRLAFIAHAYIWEHWADGNVRQSLPAYLAIPLLALGTRFGFAPLLNYWNYALWNWKRIDPNGPMTPENLKLIQNFLGGKSEEWFVVIHVAIEHAVAPLFVAVWELSDALETKNRPAILGCLKIIATGLREMVALMRRMPEHCDTEVYFKFVRPPLYGGKDKSIFPKGICYEGRTPEENVCKELPGETGAQSLIVPCLDRTFHITHESGTLSGHLHDMLHVCALEKQKNFILAIEKRKNLSAETACSYGCEVESAYWECRKLMAEFRAVHYYYAIEYIQKWSLRVKNPFGDKASGGSPYVPSLWKHFEETLGERLTEEFGGSKKAFDTLIYPFVL